MSRQPLFVGYYDRPGTEQHDVRVSWRKAGNVGCFGPSDEAAWGELFASVAPDLERFAARRGSKDPAGTANTAIEKAWRSRHTIQADSEGALRAYLFQVARNEVRQEQRAAHRRVREDLTGEPIEICGTTDSFPYEESLEADRILSHLSPLQREVLTLRVIDGYSVSETAARLNQSESNVRVLQHRSLNKLRIVLAAVIVFALVAWTFGDPFDDGRQNIADVTPMPDTQQEESLPGALRLLPTGDAEIVVEYVGIDPETVSGPGTSSLVVVARRTASGFESLASVEVVPWYESTEGADSSSRLGLPGREILLNDAGYYIESLTGGLVALYAGPSVEDVERLASSTTFDVQGVPSTDFGDAPNMVVLHQGHGLVGAAAYLSGTVTSGDREIYFDLTTTAAANVSDVYAALLYTDSAQEVSINGFEAFITSDDGWTELVWFDSMTGHVVELLTTADAASSVQLAESLRPATDIEWRSALAPGN